MKKSLTIIVLIIFVGVVLFGCSIFHKSVNQVKQESQNHYFTLKDSSGKTTIDSIGGSGTIHWGSITIDSGYLKVTEETIKEVIDSNVIHRETIRTIKEKGQKRTELSSATIRNDSASKKINQGATVNQLQGQASSSTVIAIQKNISRKSFLPWWLWLIVAALVALGWWQRNPIIEFFKPNKKSMSNTDKPLALRTSIICAALIAVVFTLIGSLTDQLAANWHHSGYKVVVIVAIVLFIVASIAAYKFADDGRYDNETTIIVVGLTVFIILWACIWMAAGNEKVAPGSRQMEDVEKADNLYSGTNHLPSQIPQP